MKQKRLLLLAILTFAIIMPIIQTHADQRGFWIYYEHNVVIPEGSMAYHEHFHNDTISAYAAVMSSTGSFELEYEWDDPVLKVYILNTDSKEIRVTWRCYFYQS